MDENPYQSSLAEDGDELANPDIDSRLASRRARLFAQLIDALVLAPIVVPLYWSLTNHFYPGAFADMVFDVDLPGEELAKLEAIAAASQPGWAFDAATSVMELAIYLAVNGVLLLRRGQTIGKWCFAIQILRRDGSRANWNHLVTKRILPFWALSLIPFIGNPLALVVFALDSLFIFRRSRYCLHDDIADTMVVKA